MTHGLATMYLTGIVSVVGVFIVWLYTLFLRWRSRQRIAAMQQKSDRLARESDDRIAAMWARVDRQMADHFAQFPKHVHGAWCHPSADGCPDRPGM